MGRASVIEAYIKRLLELEHPVTQSDLEAIAQEVGITNGELEAINLQVQAHLNRSHNYVEFDNFDKAIDALTRARALDPINLEVLNTLANVHYLRYSQDSNLNDRQQAIQLARRCLELKPNDREALALIRALDDTTSPEQFSLQTKPNIFLLIGFLENVLSPKKFTRRTKTKIALLILFLQQPVNCPKTAWWLTQKLALLTGSAAAVVFTFVGVSRLPVFSSLNAADSTLIEEIAIPTFDPGPNVPVAFSHPGLLIEPRLSRLGEYAGEPYYKFHGVVINDSGQEVTKLNLKVELLDGDGQPISTINQVAVAHNGVIIRPGDTRSFELFHKITPALISVRVSVIDIEQFVENRTDITPADSYSAKPADRQATWIDRSA